MSKTTLKRVLRTPYIKLDGTSPERNLKIEELVSLTGVSVFQANPDGSVYKDFTPDVCIIENGQKSFDVNLKPGENKIFLGIQYGQNQVQDLRMSVDVVYDKSEEEPFSLQDENDSNDGFVLEDTTTQQSSVVVEAEKAIPELEKENNFVPTTGPVVKFNLEGEDSGVYTFRGNVIYSKGEKVLVPKMELHQSLVELIPDDLLEKLVSIEKVNLKVNPIDLRGNLIHQFNLIKSVDDYSLSEDGNLHWTLIPSAPMPFGEGGTLGVSGLSYEIQFYAKFEEPKVESPKDDSSIWNDFLSPAAAEIVSAAEKSSTPLQNEPIKEVAEPVFQGYPQVDEKPFTPPTGTPIISQDGPAKNVEEFNQYNSPVADGWGAESHTENENQVKEVNLNGVMDSFNPEPQSPGFYGEDKNENLSNIRPEINFETQKPYSAPASVVQHPSNGFEGFEVHSGETLTNPSPLINNVDQYQPLSPSGTVQVKIEGGGTPGFQMPHEEGLKQNLESRSQNSLDESLKELKNEKNNNHKKNGLLEKVLDSKNKKNKAKASKKSKKGLIIGIAIPTILVVGLATAGFFYRNSGIEAMKDTRTKVEANIAKANNILSDDQVSSSESIELQKLLTENIKLLDESKSSNFFADLERKKLVESSNKVTDKASELIQKQSTVETKQPETPKTTDGTDVKEPETKTN